MKKEFISIVKNGTIQKNVGKLISYELKRFEGKRVVIGIEKLSSKRSSQQNRLFHMHVGILAREFGYLPSEMKSILKLKFLQREKIHESTGEVLKYIADTSDLKVDEFGEMIENVIMFATEYGIELPVPDESFS